MINLLSASSRTAPWHWSHDSLFRSQRSHSHNLKGFCSRLAALLATTICHLIVVHKAQTYSTLLFLKHGLVCRGHVILPHYELSFIWSASNACHVCPCYNITSVSPNISFNICFSLFNRSQD